MTLFHRCFSTILVVNTLAWFLNKMSKCLKRVKTRLFQMCISFLRCFNNMSCLYRSLLIRFLTTKNDAGIPLSTTNASITERAKNNVIMKKQTKKHTQRTFTQLITTFAPIKINYECQTKSAFFWEETLRKSFVIFFLNKRDRSNVKNILNTKDSLWFSVTKILAENPTYFSRNETSNLSSFSAINFTPCSNDSVYFFLQKSDSFNS